MEMPFKNAAVSHKQNDPFYVSDLLYQKSMKKERVFCQFFQLYLI